MIPDLRVSLLSAFVAGTGSPIALWLVRLTSSFGIESISGVPIPKVQVGQNYFRFGMILGHEGYSTPFHLNILNWVIPHDISIISLLYHDYLCSGYPSHPLYIHIYIYHQHIPSISPSCTHILFCINHRWNPGTDYWWRTRELWHRCWASNQSRCVGRGEPDGMGFQPPVEKPWKNHGTTMEKPWKSCNSMEFIMTLHQQSSNFNKW